MRFFSNKQQNAGFLLTGIIILAGIAYFTSLNNGFCLVDDVDYLFDNPYIKDLSPKGIAAIFSSFYLSNYHPLVTLIWAIGFKLFNNNMTVFHGLSLFVHLINIGLVYYLFIRLTKSYFISIFIAAFFAIHPMNVEAVAWISELKTLVYVLFFILALISYSRYVQGGLQSKHIIYTLLFFVLSLLSKSAAVVTPLVLLLIDYYTGRKFDKKNIIEKIPFFLLSVVFGILALMSQQSVIASSFTPEFPFGTRILFAFYAFNYYIVQLFAPLKLAVVHLYPAKSGNLSWIYYMAPVAALAGITILLLIRKIRKAVIFGLLFYLVNLAMVLQLIPFGQAIVAERYAYVPYLGLLFILASMLEPVWSKLIAKKGVLLIGFVVLMLSALFSLTVITINRAEFWKDSITLFKDQVNKYPKEFYSYYALGTSYKSVGKFNDAIANFDKAIQIKPVFEAYINRGAVRLASLDAVAAMIDFNEAEKYDTTNYNLYINRGMALMVFSEYKKALDDFNKAGRLNPKLVDAHTNSAFCYIKMGRYTDAISKYAVAYHYSPNDKIIPFNLAIVYQIIKAKAEACSYFKIAAENGYEPARDSLKKYCGKQ